MPHTQIHTTEDAIRRIGNSIIEIDVLRSKFDRNDGHRKLLDGIRDDLDVAQRRLVRGKLTHNSEEFQSLAASLEETSQQVLIEIQDLEGLAETLKGLVALVQVAQKLVKILV